MQRSLAIFSALMMISASSTGCFLKKSKAAPQQPTPAKAADNGPAWKLTLKSECKSEETTQCVAAYGFTVIADGHYQVGPGPQGQLQGGVLSTEELDLVASQIAKFDSAILGHAEACKSYQDAGIEQAGADDSVTLVRASTSEQTTVIHTSDAGYCFQTNTLDDARVLQKALHDLADKYYQLPFPDACMDAVNAAQSLYASSQSCASNADCTYVDTDFAPISSDFSQFVVADTCSILAPMVTANSNSLMNNGESLRAALSNAQTVCGYRMVKSDCFGIKGFNSTSGAPVCQQGQCKVNPSISF